MVSLCVEEKQMTRSMRFQQELVTIVENEKRAILVTFEYKYTKIINKYKNNLIRANTRQYNKSIHVTI